MLDITTLQSVVRVLLWSMGIVIGNVAQVMTRYLSVDILQALSWDAYISLSDQSIVQIKFWTENIDYINKKNIFQSQSCSKIVYSDA